MLLHCSTTISRPSAEMSKSRTVSPFEGMDHLVRLVRTMHLRRRILNRIIPGALGELPRGGLTLLKQRPLHCRDPVGAKRMRDVPCSEHRARGCLGGRG